MFAEQYVLSSLISLTSNIISMIFLGTSEVRSQRSSSGLQKTEGWEALLWPLT